MKKEIWKDIEDYKGLYQVSNYGRIKCLERIVPCSNQFGTYSTRKIKAYILSPYRRNAKRNDNHLVVCLYKNNIKKLHFVHRLVAQAFIKNTNNYPFINHLDGNPLNNYVDNLEWCTVQMNTKHAYKIGLAKPSNTKQVNQYTLDGTFIKTWNTIKEAEKTLKLYHISDCCHNKRNRAGNFLWKFTN